MIAVTLPAVANLTREPASGSELVSQALQGTSVTPLAEEPGFTLCRTPDLYEGWVLSEDLRAPAPGYLAGTARRTVARIAYLRPVPDTRVAPRLAVSKGTLLRSQAGDALWTPVVTPTGEQLWIQTQTLAAPGQPTLQAGPGSLVIHGRDLVGTPYLWGGGSSFGVDCSGLVQLLYALHGLLLPRDADQQYEVGVAVSRRDVMAGDLVFFTSAPGGSIVHVGLAVSRDSVLHASGSGGVMESGIDDPVCGLYAGSRRHGEWSPPTGVLRPPGLYNTTGK